ncbi:2-isopropylmalate synthase [Klebsiella pneumoniae subsp. ozaenae]|uniref:2-isopropylmalate synthase n=1 Tax=Klebsiella pneumoniae subsp. ozaenae TaxID=574 RepID=A0A377Z1Z2_KLEPO|nr:2-isopropylmalate synthase [Klebsiella pneumoniae subsp. ozaenae]
MSQQVIIFDTTLRDGEQALQASLSVKEKLQIALALERMGGRRNGSRFPGILAGRF